jgi:GDP-mannose 6-dehydrogenase
MRISVFGLGYVGAVSAACLASEGHDVIGIDVNPTKVALVASGRSPVIEPGLEELMSISVRAGRLAATTDVGEAVGRSDAAFICVGTPSQVNGSLDLTFVRLVSEQLGEALRNVERPFDVVVRSTVLPGTTENIVIPLLEKASGKRVGEDFGVCVYPEFLREGTAIDDYRHPPKVVLGAFDAAAAKRLRPATEIPGAPFFTPPIAIAEMTKYADNAWHALKVAFANEIGSIARAHDIDGGAVMDIFCSDDKLNLSSRYLRPGFAFGGSCLPKDVRVLTYQSRRLDVETPVLSSILPSNERHIDRAFDIITGRGHRQIGVLGLSFKEGTDDLRESPMVEIVERLIGKGFDVRIYDRNVNLARLVGANREYILNQIPHLERLMAGSMQEVLEHGRTIVVGNKDKEFFSVFEALRDEQILVDLVRLNGRRTDNVDYHGLCW